MGFYFQFFKNFILHIFIFKYFLDKLVWLIQSEYCQDVNICNDFMQEEDLGTEYLVRPVGRAEDEEDASDFEPEENGQDEDANEEDEDDEEEGGKTEAPPKRKRSDDTDDDDGDDGEDDERPSKRQCYWIGLTIVNKQVNLYIPIISVLSMDLYVLSSCVIIRHRFLNSLFLGSFLFCVWYYCIVIWKFDGEKHY